MTCSIHLGGCQRFFVARSDRQDQAAKWVKQATSNCCCAAVPTHFEAAMRTPEVVVHIATTKRDHAQSLSAGECSGHLFGARSAAATEYRHISRRLRVLTHSGPFAGKHLHLRPYGDTRKLAVPPDDGITTGIGTWRVVDLSAPARRRSPVKVRVLLWITTSIFEDHSLRAVVSR